ncbi:MarR family winged helix-turn-helix transcriptional regulator [Gordonia mangrovi]|nr:MarR family winged helix-turn-helix transcriptional regulator [Gordonia mangrovi]UVF80348.1 MarR family winged helix-turn-helix transcriptional regulator [Gordonia mangrovi]
MAGGEVMGGNCEEPFRELSPAQRQVWRTFVSGGWGLLAEINNTMSAAGLSQVDLRVLEGLQDREERGISELAAVVHMSVSTVSRQITRIVEQGLAERAESETDGRHRLVRITDRGREVLARHAAVRDDTIARLVVDPLTDDEFRMLGEMFAKIAANLPGKGHP